MTGNSFKHDPSYSFSSPGGENNSQALGVPNGANDSMWLTGANGSLDFEDLFGGDPLTAIAGASPFDLYTRVVLIVLYGAVFMSCSIGKCVFCSLSNTYLFISVYTNTNMMAFYRLDFNFYVLLISILIVSKSTPVANF